MQQNLGQSFFTARTGNNIGKEPQGSRPKLKNMYITKFQDLQMINWKCHLAFVGGPFLNPMNPIHPQEFSLFRVLPWKRKIFFNKKHFNNSRIIKLNWTGQSFKCQPHKTVWVCLTILWGWRLKVLKNTVTSGWYLQYHLN